MASRTLKIKPTIPAHLEERLVNKWGYVVEHKLWNQHGLFKKSYVSDKKAAVVYPDFLTKHPGLTKYQKGILERRCDNIVNFFPDPFSVPESVRARLMVITQKMTVAEAQYVLEYMDENFPIVDNGK